MFVSSPERPSDSGSQARIGHTWSQTKPQSENIKKLNC
jgi:hypothetical protein